MRRNKKITAALLFVLLGMTSLYAKNYKVVTELPRKILIRNAGTNMHMEAKNGEIKLYNLDKNNTYQEWTAYKAGSSGEYRLRNTAARQYLNIKTKKTGKIIKRKHRYLGLDRNYTKIKFLALTDIQFLIKVSGNEVADAEGGVKKKKPGQNVIPWGLNNGSNQKWHIYYKDGSNFKLFNYKNYLKEKNAASDNSNSNGAKPYSRTLEQSLYKTAIGVYMSRANHSQFITQTSGDVLAKYINGLDEAGRFGYVDTVVKSAGGNSDTMFRTAVYRELLKVNLTSESFTVRLLKGPLKKNIQKAVSGEKNPEAKDLLTQLMKKY